MSDVMPISGTCILTRSGFWDFLQGKHGLGLAASDPTASALTKLYGKWLKNLGF
jgi:hypothetical protein